ncbi:Hsp33 family molecular chaperone [Bartonella sp. A05]|uniref:Hsp33 family molecular chaperone n=1 Tax=Bartonella sp. A05 TaxID=2967261 RepID=UPI0022A961F9|nr:Hsp33 family molecular chaperone [Bartonella sp. A05]MCZ2203427.1 Hsp33 family molecular chaperone [Bartonella sp. A05]
MTEKYETAHNEASFNKVYLNRDDAVVPFQVEELDTRGRAVQLGDTLNSILTRHQYPEPVSYLLAETLVLTVLLGTSLKFEGKFILQTHSDGPVSMLVCDFTTPFSLRGYAHFDKERLEQAITTGQTSPEMLLGKGTLAFTIDQGAYTQNYQGIVALDGSNLQEVAHTYFKQSEQIPTNIRLAVARLIDRDQQGKPKKSWRAGGILTQFLPQASSHHKTHEANQKSAEPKTRTQLEDQWREVKALIGTIENAELTDPQVNTEQLLFRLFHERDIKVFKTSIITDQCSCSREKIKNILDKFSTEERSKMIENQKISVTCEFCSTIYHFKPEELSEEKA